MIDVVRIGYAFGVTCYIATMAAVAGPITSEDDPHLPAIREAFGLEIKDQSVWDISKDIWSNGSEMTSLIGYYRLQPIRYKDELCVLEQHRIQSDVDNGQIRWLDEIRTVSWQYWLAGGPVSCSVKTESDLPHTFLVVDPVELDIILFVMKRSDDLFARIAQDKKEGLHYSDWGHYLLDRMEIDSDYKKKTVYVATFRSPLEAYGPRVTFAISHGDFEVIRIGMWIM